MTAAVETAEGFMPATVVGPSDNQRMFVRYFTGALIDLVVLGLFAEFWSWVTVSSFSIALLGAVVLQFLLKGTIIVEHWVAGFFKGRKGGLMTFLRFFFAWVVLFLSKFVILEALVFMFGKNIHFQGPFHGIVALLAVVAVMLIAEEAVVRLYRRIGG